MKYILFLFIYFFNPSVVAQTSAKYLFKLEGNVIGQDSGFVHLKYTNYSAIVKHDSCFLKKGNFKFEGFVFEPTDALFYGKIESKNVDDLNFTDIFIEPAAMKATLVVNDFKHAQISGSKSQNEWYAYTKQIETLNLKWKTMWMALKVAKDSNDRLKIKSIYESQMPLYQFEVNKIRYNFIKNLPNSFISSYLLFIQCQKVGLDTVRKLYSNLSATIQGSKDGKRIKDFIIKGVDLTIGKPAPTFEQKDLQGENISLAHLKGKYVLLNFWASWCGPCREEHPYLKKAYYNFHNKGFEIISFSLDNLKSKDDWKQAIKKDNLNWIQLCDFKELDNDAVKKYNVLSIPANYLVNPDGKIIAIDLRGKELEKKLEQVIEQE